MIWTLVILFIVGGFVLLFLFFAGVRRNQAAAKRMELPEEYLAIVSDRPPDYFVPIEDRISSTDVIFLWKDTTQEKSRLYRAAEFVGYHEARAAYGIRSVGGKMKSLSPVRPLKFAWRSLQNSWLKYQHRLRLPALKNSGYRGRLVAGH